MNTSARVVKLHPGKELKEVLTVNAGDVSRPEFLGSGIEGLSSLSAAAVEWFTRSSWHNR
jgi:hypothetical protein